MICIDCKNNTIIANELEDELIALENNNDRPENAVYNLECRLEEISIELNNCTCNK